DSATSPRVEPNLGPASVSSTPGTELRAAAAPASAAASTAVGAGETAPRAHAGLDQLSRIEDKTARIEEKYARAEALLQRVEASVEAATSRMHHVASQADLMAVRDQVTATATYVRRLPGLTALALTAIVTSLLTAALVLVLQRYGLPWVLPR
ncbi:MAG TPA: hypothetical protein VHN20_10535, partial [Beijerinckiaceae bacterium]|nr:hypothetical protein [Beijerinckiaceae bacterium]